MGFPGKELDLNAWVAGLQGGSRASEFNDFQPRLLVTLNQRKCKCEVERPPFSPKCVRVWTLTTHVTWVQLYRLGLHFLHPVAASKGSDDTATMSADTKSFLWALFQGHSRALFDPGLCSFLMTHFARKYINAVSPAGKYIL